MGYIPPRTADAWDLTVVRRGSDFDVVRCRRLGEFRIPGEYTGDDEGPRHKCRYELLGDRDSVLFRAAVADKSGMNAEGFRRSGSRGNLSKLPLEARQTSRFHLIAPRIPGATRLRIRTNDVDPQVTQTDEQGDLVAVAELPGEELPGQDIPGQDISDEVRQR